MKRIFITMMCMLCVMQIHAAIFTFTQNGITYRVDTSKGATITGVSSDLKGDIVLPGAVAQTLPGTAYVVKEIANNAFKGVPGITSIKVPQAVEYIGDYAFSGCTGLTSISIPSSIVSISHTTFAGCTNLANIELYGSSSFQLYYSKDGVLYKKDYLEIYGGDLTVAYPNKLGSSYTVPDFVAYIGAFTFYDCIDLKSVTIHNKVNTIGEEAFRGCAGLPSIIIPEGRILRQAFDGCSSLTSVQLSEGVTEIGKEVFSVSKKTI